MDATDIRELRDFVKIRTFTPETSSRYSAWVLIWYPHAGSAGHASMFIGDILETSLYVSWWPEAGDAKKVLFGKFPSRISAHGNADLTTYRSDAYAEGGLPDVIYGLMNLNEHMMKMAWYDICHKQGGSSFRTVGKNCADIVGRVINAGLVGSSLRAKAFDYMQGGFLPCTPKRIGIACNYLRDKNMAVKISLHAKSLNLNPLKFIFRLR
ncbi:hypothetical protein J1781_25790 [Rahnella sp. C60]|uniref:Uncharacterized protein n=3 Tax=Rahnella TaxID=34037 RepID=A0ABS6L6G9_9GAMM|nr:hypothetical protein [Rahnella perminowiae]UJD90139.1 hypothetical protein FS594_15880 [Rahnella aquatilis]MBU9818245.1 hypothetical protein [Rahnella perminowiae]MBU9825794.1 hypothetical protein [Rahnella perminowiae]MBU9837442.1 hypothetical protein [Rahnella perminowiae]MCR9000743.1 hypothetical protein [Rahnella perminowiae]